VNRSLRLGAGDEIRCTQVGTGMTSLLRFRRALLLAVALAACSDDPTVPPDQAAGTYVLESVTGRGPTSGTFVLTADGRAERQARFTLQGSSVDQHLVGSFRIDGEQIAFNLVPSDQPADFFWPVTGQWLGSEFTIKYADPADGPDIVERYRKQ
jgi:hypothetical protein